jgi:hypothetical protein
MALFGEKCARCGKKRTREEYEGRPTCKDCQELLERKLEASREAQQRCPVDGASMEKEIVMSVIVDRCPSCHGVWLDGGELDQLKGEVAADVSRELIRGFAGRPF